MHDAELSRGEDRHRREAFDVKPHRGLFDVFPLLRAASAESLHAFFFAPKRRIRSVRTSARMIAKLLDEGYLARQPIDGGRSIYHLTRKSVALFTAEGIDVSDMLRRSVTPAIGGYLWLRASLLCRLLGWGYRVGRGPEAVHALRRFFVDAVRERAVRLPRREDYELTLKWLRENFRPPILDECRACSIRVIDAVGGRCPRCRRRTHGSLPARTFRCGTCSAVVVAPGPHRASNGLCAGLVRELDCLPFDLAWRWSVKTVEVTVPFVDNPARGLLAQLKELPLRHTNDPKVRVILRTTDPDSLFSRTRGEWANIGPRHRLMLRAFSHDGLPREYPYVLSSTIAEVAEDLQLNLIR